MTKLYNHHTLEEPAKPYEILPEHFSLAEKAINRMDWLRCAEERKIALADFFANLSFQVQKQIAEVCAPKWISVEERLPKEDGNYLCLNNRTEGITPLYFRARAQCFSVSKLVNSAVTHWMPLPEALPSPPSRRI